MNKFFEKLAKNRELKNIVSKKGISSLTFTFAIVIILITFLIILVPVETQNLKPISYKITNSNVSKLYFDYRLDKLVNQKYEQMTLDERIGQLFMVNVDSTYLNENSLKLFQDYHVGGVIIMSDNIASQKQVHNLINEINSYSKTKLFISTDQEGGRVARVVWDQARFISQHHVGVVDRDDFTYETASQHAQALHNLGINQNLAPVVDIAPNTTSVMFARSFGSDPEKVAKHTKKSIEAHKNKNILTTAKHFPGIGRTSVDSHNQLPQIDIEKNELARYELIPFKSAIEEEVEFIMSGHVLYPQIDPDFPASLSSVFLKDILRNDMKFEGIIITDDINMSALDNYPGKAIRSLEAGNDMILIVDYHEEKCKYIDQVKKAFEEGRLNKTLLEDRVGRVLRLKYEKGIIK